MTLRKRDLNRLFKRRTPPLEDQITREILGEMRSKRRWGITGIITSEKNGEVLDCFVINESDQIILVTDKGQIIRVNVNQIRIAGRSTKGVSVFKIPESDSIVSVSRIQDLDTANE